MRGVTAISLAVAARLDADADGTAVDITAFDGPGLLVINARATEAADNTADFVLEDSADGSTDWAAVPGVTIAQVTNAEASHQVLHLDTGSLRGHVRVGTTLGGTTPAVTFAAELVGKEKY